VSPAIVVLRAVGRDVVNVGAGHGGRASGGRRARRITAADRIRVIGIELEDELIEVPRPAVVVGLRGQKPLVEVLGSPVEESNDGRLAAEGIARRRVQRIVREGEVRRRKRDHWVSLRCLELGARDVGDASRSTPVGRVVAEAERRVRDGARGEKRRSAIVAGNCLGVAGVRGEIGQHERGRAIARALADRGALINAHRDRKCIGPEGRKECLRRGRVARGIGIPSGVRRARAGIDGRLGTRVGRTCIALHLDGLRIERRIACASIDDGAVPHGQGHRDGAHGGTGEVRRGRGGRIEGPARRRPRIGERARVWSICSSGKRNRLTHRGFRGARGQIADRRAAVERPRNEG
jgi:hypothetical protein